MGCHNQSAGVHVGKWRKFISPRLSVILLPLRNLEKKCFFVLQGVEESHEGLWLPHEQVE